MNTKICADRSARGHSGSGAALGIVAIAAITPAWGQGPSDGTPVLEEVVVTGSLIRGVAPVGTQVSAVTNEDIERSGAMSTNQILSTIPQVTNAFNILPNTPTGLGRSTFRPNIRNLGASGGTTTLVLIDGHNVVGSGILQTTPDAGLLPPGAIERVEVVPDGGSSLYGSDAVGGILNFITRDRFDGVEIDGTAGVADDYNAYSFGVTGGGEWRTGSAMASIFYRENEGIYAADRSRPRQDLRSFGGNDFRVRTCAPGTIIAGGVTYALPNRQPGTVNLCDTGVNGTVTPEEDQVGLYAALSQEISSSLDFGFKLFASRRETFSRATQIANAGATIDATNPFYQPVAGEASHTVAMNYEAALGPYVTNSSELGQWHATPTLTWKLGSDWVGRAMVDYGRSTTEVHVADINAVAQAAALRGPGLTTATALNPYNTALTNPAVISAISNFENHARSVQDLTTYRVSADGPIGSLPGGDLRVALGAQYQHQTADVFSVFAPRGSMTGAVIRDVSRNVSSVFGEVHVPIIGDGNSLPGVRSLEVDLSARFDDYSDVGSTTNPKIGATWEIVDGLRVRGNWGTSFNAPSLADTTGAVDQRVQVFASSTNIRAGDPATDRNRPNITLSGGNPNLKPQTADTWSIGLDFTPTQLPGLETSLTWWSVELENIVGGVPSGSPLLYTLPAYASFYYLRPTLQQAVALTQGQIIQGAASIESLYGTGNDPYAIYDLRRNNLANLDVQGIDFRVAYRRAVNWGDVYGSVTGSHALKRDQQPVDGAQIVDQLASDVPQTQVSVLAGMGIGRLNASVTVNRTADFKVAGVAGQTSVSAFTLTNLYVQYDIGNDWTIGLNADNVFDKEAPFVNVNGGFHTVIGFLTHGTLGRRFNLSVRKRL